jgi:hypothetical protein
LTVYFFSDGIFALNIPPYTVNVNGFYWTLKDVKNKKAPYFTGAFALSRISLDLILVEAGGIEPPSESIQP